MAKILKNAPKVKGKKKEKIKLEEAVNPKTGLNLNQEVFCRCYATVREFFGNGVQSYIEAYKPDMSKKGWYNLAKFRAHELLTNPNVMKRITELLPSEGWNDANMDKQLTFVASQFADLRSKVNAIKEYNRVKRRVDEGGKLIIPTTVKIVIEQPVKSEEPKQPEEPTNEPIPDDDNSEQPESGNPGVATDHAGNSGA